MTTSDNRPPMKDMVFEILNKTSNTQFTLAEMRDAVNDMHVLRNINAYSSGSGAVTACIQRMWDRDLLPEGWVFDTLHAPKMVRRQLFVGERAKLLELEYAHRKADPLHRATPEGEREANANIPVQTVPVLVASAWTEGWTQDPEVIALVRVYTEDEDYTFDLTDPETLRLVIEFLKRMEKIDHLRSNQ